MAPHSSTLAWKIPWTEEPGRVQSTGSLRVERDWATSLSLFTFRQWRRKWQPTPVLLTGESQGRGAWWAVAYGIAQSRTRLKRLSSSSSNLQSRVFGIWFLFHILHQGFFMYLPWNDHSGGNESACSVGDPGSISGSGCQENPLENGMATTPVFLPGEFHRQRYSPLGCKD